MRFLLAPDTFKDSLSAEKVAKAMERGIHARIPDASCYTLFASDGGEGFLESVARYVQEVHKIFVPTTDPLGRPIETYYLWDPENEVAYVELAKASGIELLKESERDVMKTSTLGTGVLLMDAVSHGARKVFLGIGGSATNDGGMGIAKAFGYTFYDSENNSLEPIGENLQKVVRITKPDTDWQTEFIAVNDVLNPLYGPKGAAYTYAKQKGADSDQIAFLDHGLENLAVIVKVQLGQDDSNAPGSGAAGGTAYGLKSFLNANYMSGTQFILDLAHFEELILEKGIDAIFTGEGKIDFQTAYGKFVFGIIQAANRYSVPVLAVCGKLDLDENGVTELGLLAAKQVYDPAYPVAYSFENAYRLVSERTQALLQEQFPEAIQ